MEDAKPEHRAGKVYTFSCLCEALNMARGDTTGTLHHFHRMDYGEYVHHVGQIAGVAIQPEPGKRGFLLECLLPWGLLPVTVVDDIVSKMALSLLCLRFAPGEPWGSFAPYESISLDSDIPPTAIHAFADVERWADGTPLHPVELEWQPFNP